MDRCFYSERDEVGLLSPHPQLCQRLRGRLLVQTDLPCPGPRDVPSALCMGQGPQAPVLGPLTSSLRADTSGDHPASVLRGGGEEVVFLPLPLSPPAHPPLPHPPPPHNLSGSALLCVLAGGRAPSHTFKGSQDITGFPLKSFSWRMFSIKPDWDWSTSLQ